MHYVEIIVARFKVAAKELLEESVAEQVQNNDYKSATTVSGSYREWNYDYGILNSKFEDIIKRLIDKYSLESIYRTAELEKMLEHTKEQYLYQYQQATNTAV